MKRIMITQRQPGENGPEDELAHGPSVMPKQPRPIHVALQPREVVPLRAETDTNVDGDAPELGSAA
jgi:hypothetical protein